jgi:hypothetical protein
VTEARVETEHVPVEAKIKTGLVEVEATDLEANHEGKEAVVEQQDIHSKGTAVESSEGMVRHLAIGCYQ